MTSKPISEPKDLGIKIGTKQQVLWENVKKESEILIQQSLDNLIIQRALSSLAAEKIKIEQEIMKK